MCDPLPIGYFAAHALDRLAMLYRRIAESDRRELLAEREDNPAFAGDLRVRAEAMDTAARMACDAADSLRRTAFMNRGIEWIT